MEEKIIGELKKIARPANDCGYKASFAMISRRMSDRKLIILETAMLSDRRIF
jgi:hypothetical protein